MKVQFPKWLETTLSFILITLLLVAYLVSHTPQTKNVIIVPAPTTALAGLVFNHPFTIGQKEIQVALAQTSTEQEQGLSGTSPITENQGLLFIFPNESTPSFWMKDMNYPLDIIWISADKKVVDITPNLKPATFPKTFASKAPILYVLEVQAGFAEKNNIAIGTSVSF